jgi:hypothetical protein
VATLQFSEWESLRAYEDGVVGYYMTFFMTKYSKFAGFCLLPCSIRFFTSICVSKNSLLSFHFVSIMTVGGILDDGYLGIMVSAIVFVAAHMGYLFHPGTKIGFPLGNGRRKLYLIRKELILLELKQRCCSHC